MKNLTAEEKKLIKIYNGAYNFLKDKVGEVTLRKQLEYYHKYKPATLKDVFRRMLETLKNKQGYVNFIADVKDMKDIVCKYDSSLVVKKYGNNWKELFSKFKKMFGGKYKMDIKNKHNAWVMYSKGVLSCAKFLSNFKNLMEFDVFVKSFFFNEFTIAALPMLLDKEIFGFGFPLACDFLKEMGYVQYGKPDVHLKGIFAGLKIVDDPSDYEVFKKIVRIGLLTKQDPVIVDKVFWLIGSGNFYESGIKIPRQKSAFLTYIKPQLT